MSDESRVDELFLRVVELKPAERQRVLDAECPDPAARRRVEQLLESDAGVPAGFLEGEPRAEPEVREGARIGPYRVLERIGEGGMGTVYAARQSFPQREVALKVLQSGRVSDDAIRRFRHEIEVLGRLQHSGIARIYDAGVTEAPDAHGVSREVPYFTMELVRGVPLVRYAREQGLVLEGRLELLARVCDAVHYAHQRGVIHRDLKADNVLVTTEESTASGESGADAQHAIGQPKVLDFGIARMIDPELANATRQTVAGALIGTLSSMSPEQVAGDRGLVDVRTDVYALGVMLYELLCGRAPIALDGLSVPQAILRIVEESPAPPGALDPALRGDLSTIALKALEKDPERRYQTAAELAFDLRAHLAGEPIEARADSRLYHLRRSLRRHRLAFGAAVAFSLLCGVFALVSVRQARESAALAVSEAAARRLATEDFERALGAIELLTELGSERLIEIPQADGARRELLEAAAGFHRELLAAHPEVDGLDLRQAVARYRIAQLERDLGHLDVALAEARRASEDFEEQLAAGAAEGISSRRGLALSLTLLGNLLYRSGELDQAEAQLRRAAALAEELREGGARSSEVLELFASSHKHLSIVLRARGQMDEALGELVVAVEALEGALEASSSPFLRRELVALLQQLSVLRLERGDSEGVEQNLLRAIEVGESLLEERPDHPGHLQDLAAIRSNYSFALKRWGRPAEGAEQLDLSIEASERLIEEHPALEGPRGDLFAAYNNRATLRMSSGELEGADADMSRAAELLQGLLAANPSADRTASLAVLENNQAAVQIHLEHIPEAIVTLERAIGHAESALDELPGRADLRAVIRYARSNLALCHSDAGRYAEAVEIIRRVGYVADGYSGVNEVFGVLQVWQNAASWVEIDELLPPERREELVREYLGEATGYLESALGAGFDELEALEGMRDWSLLLTHEPFERALRGE